MASLIDYTFFTTGRLIINNLSDSGFVGTGTQADIAQYIIITEKKILKRFLGDDLYTAFVAGLAQTVVDARWTALKNKLVDSTNKLSPLANFTYHTWLQDHQTVQTAGETVKYTASDTTPFMNVQMVCDIYNDGVGDLSEVYDWLEENAATYPEWEQEAFDFARINPYDI